MTENEKPICPICSTELKIGYIGEDEPHGTVEIELYCPNDECQWHDMAELSIRDIYDHMTLRSRGEVIGLIDDEQKHITYELEEEPSRDREAYLHGKRQAYRLVWKWLTGARK